jgi:cytosine/adenosine deaminase-related metal-dependent hydrolase
VIVGPCFVVSGGRSPQVLEDGGVRVVGAHIAQVARIATLAASHPEETLWPARGRVLMPGLVNAHAHLARHLARGLTLESREEWRRYDDALAPEDIHWGAMAALVEGVRHGVTTVCDLHRSANCLDLSLSEITGAADRLGVRLATGYAAGEDDSPLTRAAARRESLGLAADLEHRHQGRLRGLAGVHATSLAGLGTLLDETRATGGEVPLHVELDLDRSAAPGREPRLAPGGVVLWAHAERAPVGLRARARERGDALSSSRAQPQAGREEFAWGSDSGLNAPPLPDGLDAAAEDYYRRVWVNGAEWGARHFGEGLGLIEPGAPADLVLLDYAPPTELDGRTLWPHLLNGLARARVSGVMVAGEIVMDHGQLTTVDETEVAARSRECARRVWAKLG